MSMGLLITDDVGEVKLINTSNQIDTTNKESTRPKITSFYEPTPHNSIVGICSLPPTPAQLPPVFPPLTSSIISPQYVAILRNPEGLDIVDFVSSAKRVKATELRGEAMQPDVLWSSSGSSSNKKEEKNMNGDVNGSGSSVKSNEEKWIGLRREGGILYAWTAEGRVDLWGGGWGRDGVGPQRHWAARVPISPSGMKVSEVRLQPYDSQNGSVLIPRRFVLAVGYTTEQGEVEIFTATPSTINTDTKEEERLSLTSIFKSKPPRPNALKLPIPGGISAICWLPTPPPPPPSALVELPKGISRYARNRAQEAEDEGREVENLFFATGTPSGDIRLYSTMQSRRPVFLGPMLVRGGAAPLRRGVGTSVTKVCGKGGILTLTYIPPVSLEVDEDDYGEELDDEKSDDETEKDSKNSIKKQRETTKSQFTFAFSDENARLGLYVLTPVPPTSTDPYTWKGRMIQLLPGGITGTIRAVSLYYHPAHLHPSLLLPHPLSSTSGRSPILLAATGLDRYLRVYQAPKRNGSGAWGLVSRVYIGTRGNGVVWVGGEKEGVVGSEVFEDEKGRKIREGRKRREEREREVDEVWEGIEDANGNGVVVVQEDEDDAVMEGGSEVSEDDDDDDDEDEDDEEEEQEEDEDSDDEEETSSTPPPPPKHKKRSAPAMFAKPSKPHTTSASKRRRRS